MIYLIIGVVLGIIIFGWGRAYTAGEEAGIAAQQAAIKAAKEAAEAEAEEKASTLPQMKATAPYKPKGYKTPKPVFLPTAAASVMEEDPVIAWEPIAVVDDEGVIDWEKTEANAVFMNPATGELIEYGHK